MPITTAKPPAEDGPLYRVVKRRILQSLALGEWISSQTLPSQNELCKRYNVSVGTLRKAVDELVQDKILRRKAGFGTFIAPHDEDRTLFHFFNIVSRDGERKLPVSELQGFSTITANREIAKQLALKSGERVYRIGNLRKIDGAPVLHDTIYVACRRFQGMTREMFQSRTQTIYDLYLTGFGINIIRTVETLAATACPKEEAAYLGLRAGIPVLEISRVALTYDDEPIEYRVSYMSTESRVYVNDQGKTHR